MINAMSNAMSNGQEVISKLEQAYEDHVEQVRKIIYEIYNIETNGNKVHQIVRQH